MSSQKWRNAGAPFTTEDGRVVGTGDVFEAPALSRTVRMRRKKLHPVAPRTPETVGEAPDDPEARFPGVDFASDVAYELARDEGLAASDFEGREGTGQEGAFKKADVTELLEERDGET